MPVTPEMLDELVAELGADCVVLEDARKEAYRHDWARGEAGVPCAVARPRDAAQVQVAVRWAARHGIPIVPRGAGSGLAGGS